MKTFEGTVKKVWRTRHSSQSEGPGLQFFSE